KNHGRVLDLDADRRTPRVPLDIGRRLVELHTTLSPASTRGRSSAVSRARCTDASPNASWSSWARFMKKCRSCSHVKPMPPCTWSAELMTRFDASEHHVFAVDAATWASGSAAPMHHAAQ